MHWIFAHLIGDYILQTDWMAANKKANGMACLAHVLTYIAPFFLCGLPLWSVLAIAVQHYVQDRSNFVVWFMRWKGSARFTEPPMAPWSIIITDNILHILWIALIAGAA
jgi:hypothetical protein